MRKSIYARVGIPVVLLVACATTVLLSQWENSKSGLLGLRFDPNPLILPSAMQEGQEYDLDLMLENSTSDDACVIGAVEFCAGACFSVKGLPAVIPGRGKGHVTLHIKANGPGPIEDEVTVFTDRASQPTLILKVSGYIWGAGSGARQTDASPSDR